MATKLLEVVALGIVLGSARRWIAPVVFATVLTGGFAWAAQLRGGGDTHQHDGKTLQVAAAPSDDQRLAAEQLVDNTRAGISRYADLGVALADGYRPSTPVGAPTVHYVNPKYRPQSDVLDTQHPPTLVYANTREGPLLLGAMYIMPKAGVPGPTLGGSLTEWHVHPNLCFLPGPTIDGLQSPFGTCPTGSINAPTPAMLHVWIVANPAGPFGDLSPAYVARLTNS